MRDSSTARAARPPSQRLATPKQSSSSHPQRSASGSSVRLQVTPSAISVRASRSAGNSRTASVSSSLRVELPASVSASVPASLRSANSAPPFLHRSPSRSLQNASTLSSTSPLLIVPTITDMGLLSAALLERTQQAVKLDEAVESQLDAQQTLLELPRQFVVSHSNGMGETQRHSSAGSGQVKPSTKQEHIDYFFKTVDDAAREDAETTCVQVFGRSLQDARRTGACAAVQLYEHALDIPIVVAVSVQELERRASAYAKHGTLGQLNAFKSQHTREFESLVDFFNSCPTLNDCSLTQDDPQDIFELLLLYVGSLPRPVLDASTVNQLVSQCVDASEPPHRDRITSAQLILSLIPTEERHLLVFVMRFLVRLASVLAQGRDRHLDRQTSTAPGSTNITPASRSTSCSVSRNDLEALAKRFGKALAGTRSSSSSSPSIRLSSAGNAKTSGTTGLTLISSEPEILQSEPHALRAVLWLLKNWSDVLPGVFPRPDPLPPPSQAPSNDSAATLAADVENLRPPSPRPSWIRRKLSSKPSSNRKRHNDVNETPPPPLPPPVVIPQSKSTPRRPISTVTQSQNQTLQSLKAEVGRLKRENAALRKDAADLRKANPRLAVDNARLTADNLRLTTNERKVASEMKQFWADKVRLAKRVEELERATREREYGAVVERVTEEETPAVAPHDQDVKADFRTATPTPTSSGAQAKKLIDAATNYPGQHSGNVIVGRRASALRRAIGLGPPAATTTTSPATTSAKLLKRKPPTDKVAVS